MTEGLEQQVSAIALLNDPVRRSLYQFTAGSDEPVSRDQAAEAVGVQRALAAFHLDKLAEDGLLDVEFRRLTGRSGPGAGRPAKLYRRSAREFEVTLPPREYDLAAHLLAAAVEESARAGGDVRRSLEAVAFEFGRRLGEEADGRPGRGRSAARRREALFHVLRDHGFEPRWSGGEIVLGNCPFHSLAERFTDLVCGMNLHIMRGLRSAVTLPHGVLEPHLSPQPSSCCVRFSVER